MPTWLKWLLSGAGIFVLITVLGAVQRGSPVALALGCAVLLWLGAGALIALRAVLRFLRR